jgi:L-threonylcarbamoyladenylate synthase
LVADVAAMGVVARMTTDALRLVEAFMPGPLTLVLDALVDVSAGVTGGGTVGVRIPDHPVPLELLRASGPIAASSANRSGEPTPGDLAGVRSVFGDAVDAYVDGDPPREPRASTVLDLTGVVPVVRRSGALAIGDLEHVLGRRIGG